MVTRQQLLRLGFTEKAIRHRLADGRLHVTWPGCYAVGRRELDQYGWWTAAVLACGRGTVLSDQSAAELWEIRQARGGAIDVSVRGAAGRTLRGISARRRTLDASDITECRGIPTTTPIRTLIDIAPNLTTAELEGAINEADKLDLVKPETLRAAVDARKGKRGAAVVRTFLDSHTLLLTDSELERRFIPIAKRAGLPRPETQAHLHGFRVDFYFRPLDLVVETDGLRYHRTAAQQAQDRLRDQTLTAAGLTVLRFTHSQVRYEPDHVERILRSAGSSGPRRPRAGSGGRPSR